MIQGLNNGPRIPDRELDEVTRNDRLNHGVKGLNQARETSAQDSNFVPGDEIDEFTAVINFDLVPSGRLHMNREAREHIVDFFQ